MAQDVHAATKASLKLDCVVVKVEDSDRSQGRGLRVPWIVVAALMVRVVFMLALGTYKFDRVDDQSSVNEVTYIARSIATGHGFSSPFSEGYTGPTAWVAPVYPYFVAGVFKVFGVMSERSLLVIQVLQSLFSALTVIPLVGILTFCGSKRSGVVAGWMWALFPWFSRWGLTWIWDTSLSTLLLSCLVWYALWLANEGSVCRWLGFGTLWGVTLLTNPSLVCVLPVTLAWVWLSHAREQRWRAAICTLAACLMLIAPWMIRNRVVMGGWTAVSDSFGFEFAFGNYQHSFGRGWGGRHPMVNPREFERYREKGELVYVHDSARQAAGFVHSNPNQFLILTAKRILYFWDGSAMLYRGPVAWYWMPASFAIASILLVPGLSLCWPLRLRAWWLLWGILMVYPIPFYLTYAPIRQRHAIEPLMLTVVVLAAVEGVAHLTRTSETGWSFAERAPATGSL